MVVKSTSKLSPAVNLFHFEAGKVYSDRYCALCREMQQPLWWRASTTSTIQSDMIQTTRETFKLRLFHTDVIVSRLFKPEYGSSNCCQAELVMYESMVQPQKVLIQMQVDKKEQDLPICLLTSMETS